MHSWRAAILLGLEAKFVPMKSAKLTELSS